jgi:hypothetical protein
MFAPHPAPAPITVAAVRVEVQGVAAPPLYETLIALVGIKLVPFANAVVETAKPE